MDYITLADITNVHFNQFPDEARQPYIDEANGWYEDFADTIGVVPEQLVSPIPFLAKRLLANYAVMRHCEDSIGTNNITVNDGEDMYVANYKHYHSSVQNIKSEITPEMVMGIKTGRVGRSVSFGKMFRT